MFVLKKFSSFKWWYFDDDDDDND